ncbi:MAG: S41 family peptidase [Bacteroidia bacterium]|nr:S41 family peptidase [Bacteroidia bacterium]
MKKFLSGTKRVLKKPFVAVSLTLLIIGGFAFKPVEDYFEISKNIDIFVTLFREVNVYYVDEAKPGELMKTGIDAMLESLDPYTNYISESDIEDYRFMTTGEYGGIGAVVRQVEGQVVISEPYEGFSAQKAGMKAGDIITEIDGKSIKTKASDEISHLLKGQAGTPIKLTITRLGEPAPLVFEMKREEIKVKNVPYFGMLNNEVGYIKLTGFTENAAQEVKDALIKLKNEKGAKSIVLDLRENPGGLLREAVEIVNLFVDKGQDIVFTKGKVKDWDKTYKSLSNPVDVNIPLTVLVNKGSASASEIVSGSLQDLDRAVIVGQRTYGKGLVQQTRPLTYGAQLKVTVAKYYVPSGRCIQALDYSHRTDDGSVEKVPDSLITAFKTKNGRVVYDGAGINPDLITETATQGVLLSTLLNRNFIFEYATLYASKNKTIAAAKDFKLSDVEYDAFVKFMKEKNYEYSTRSEKELFAFKESAETEKYYEDVKAEYQALKEKMTLRKNDDLIKRKAEIKPWLEEEIASRYYYQGGRLEANVKYDKEISEALKVASDAVKMKSVLTTIEKAKKPFNPAKRF